MSNQDKENKEITQLISTITSSKKEEESKYKGFEIISNALQNTLTKQQLLDAIKIMRTIVMDATKQERDDKYLFGKGLKQFNETYKKDKGKSMTKEQYEKMVYKIENIRPLIEFLIKIEDVIK